MEEQAFFAILQSAPKGDDRRRNPRTQIGALASLQRIVPGEQMIPLHVLVIDSSEGGIGIRCPVGLIREAPYRISIDHEGETFTAQVRIISCRRRRDGSYDIGARFG
jgi:hypothetical protein